MNTPSNYDHVFRVLKGLRAVANGWECYCPAHEDDRPGGGRSLSVRVVGGGKLAMKCHGPSGCEIGAILEALGLRMEDLFPDNPHVTGRVRVMDDKGEFVCSYDYRDEDRKLLFQVVRWKRKDGSKSFSQRRPNPEFDTKRPPNRDNPEFVSGVEGVRRVLYRLPEMLAALAIKPETTVFIHEGEKAADLAWKLKLTSTCSPMGAGKWNDIEYVRHLVGRNVVVFEDDDPIDEKNGTEPGERHANDICLSLYGAAKSIRKVRLTNDRKKGDFADWYTSNNAEADPKGAVDSLRLILGSTPEWNPKLDEVAKSVKQIMGIMARRRMKGIGSPFTSRDEWFGHASRLWLSLSLAMQSKSNKVDLEALGLASVLALGADEVGGANGQVVEG